MFNFSVVFEGPLLETTTQWRNGLGGDGNVFVLCALCLRARDGIFVSGVCF